jgi:hypothetical protein
VNPGLWQIRDGEDEDKRIRINAGTITREEAKGKGISGKFRGKENRKILPDKMPIKFPKGSQG